MVGVYMRINQLPCALNSATQGQELIRLQYMTSANLSASLNFKFRRCGPEIRIGRADFSTLAPYPTEEGLKTSEKLPFKVNTYR